MKLTLAVAAAALAVTVVRAVPVPAPYGITKEARTYLSGITDPHERNRVLQAYLRDPNRLALDATIAQHSRDGTDRVFDSLHDLDHIKSAKRLRRLENMKFQSGGALNGIAPFDPEALKRSASHAQGTMEGIEDIGEAFSHIKL